MVKPSDVERFMAHVRHDGECWVWTGHLLPNGYAQFTYGGRQKYAHRAALELLKHEDLSGLIVDHTCWVRSCVNPHHLRAVTQSQNHQNRSRKSLTGKSGHRGVTWDAARNKWHVHVKSNGVTFNGGRFNQLDEAVQAAVALRARLFDNYVEFES